ncbi:MAG: DUF4157 domain-containing protein [Deltaproteobacteria bacterium]|nr:DUF4157 domain-containing protein [Deltaproteobacteria bacterium]
MHTDDRANAITQSVHARAFTAGQDMVLGANLFAPKILTGRRLLAHELTDLIQQGSFFLAMQTLWAGTKAPLLQDASPCPIQRGIPLET